jgi:hypothetical protein
MLGVLLCDQMITLHHMQGVLQCVGFTDATSTHGLIPMNEFEYCVPYLSFSTSFVAPLLYCVLAEHLSVACLCGNSSI